MGNESGLHEMKWTPEELHHLQSMWDAGFKAKDIGKTLGRSKNSVIGAAHRLGLKEHNNSPRIPREQKMERPKKESMPTNVRVFVRPPQKIKDKPMPPTTGGVTIEELRIRSCRAVTSTSGGPHGLALYCGEPTSEGIVFCSYHCSIYYQPRGTKSNDRIRPFRRG